MSKFNPSQVSFAGGEISPRLRARVDSDLYRSSLAYCENFIPLAHGPARMRAGTRLVAAWGEATSPRLIPFNVSGDDPYCLALHEKYLKIYDHAGNEIPIYANLVTNGTFDANAAYWTGYGNGSWVVGGFFRLTLTGYQITQTVAWTDGATYTVRYRARSDGGTVRVVAGQIGLSFGLDQTDTLTAKWQTFTHTFVATGTAPTNWDVIALYSAGAGTFWDIDDVFVTMDVGAHPAHPPNPPGDHIDTPWTLAQAAEVQIDQDLTRDRMMLVHGEAAPQLLTLNVHGLFEMRAATFTGAPTNWSGSNYPSVIDWGFQGRLWLGASPDEPNAFWGSKSGYPFDFTLGVDDSDAVAFTASIRGALRWMQGQKSLLMGAERAEQSAKGVGIITPSSINVEDESAFGSAPIQAAHLGDEVVFVARNLRDIRALSFDGQVKNGWVSRTLSFVAEHLVTEASEVHYAATPDPMIVVVLADRTIVACVYNRAEKITAWWRIGIDMAVDSCAVTETADGSELWIAGLRGVTPVIEAVPLHEAGAVYLDAFVSGTVDLYGNLAVSAGLDGVSCSAIVDGAVLSGTFTPTYSEDESHVRTYYVALGVEHAGKSATVGVPYEATLTQLPLEGGLAAGSSQAARRRRMKVRLRLNDSALPKVNGQRPPERLPADPMDTGTDLFTGDVDVQVLGWEENGALTITQDLPFRTEILGVFGDAISNED